MGPVPGPSLGSLPLPLRPQGFCIGPFTPTISLCNLHPSFGPLWKEPEAALLCLLFLNSACDTEALPLSPETGTGGCSVGLGSSLRPSVNQWVMPESQGDSSVSLTLPTSPHGSAVQNACNAGATGDTSSIPGSGRVPWRRKWQPTPVFLPGESHGQRSLARLQSIASKTVGDD